MRGSFSKVLLFVEILVGFSAFFGWIRGESMIHRLMDKARKTMEDSADRRSAGGYKRAESENHKGRLYALERTLLYSGVSRKWHLITPEVWILGNMICAAALWLGGSFCGLEWYLCGALICVLLLAEKIVLNLMMSRNFNATDDNLLKFLDFLGNYSLTSGEITSVLSQVGPYLEEPLKGVLEDCFYESQTTGDTSTALLAMAEKIQHPKFKEFVRNLEISIRYSADFTTLVSQSRRSVREFMRLRNERKSLAREAFINMLILGAMTLVVLKSVEALVEIPLEQIMFHTVPGIGCVIVICIIMALFYGQVRKLDK